MPSSIGQPQGPSELWRRYLTHVVSNAAGHAGRDLRKIPSRIASPSTNGPRLSTAEPRAAIGRVTALLRRLRLLLGGTCESYLRSLATELLETLSRAEIVVDDDRTGDEGGADDGAGDEPRPTA